MSFDFFRLLFFEDFVFGDLQILQESEGDSARLCHPSFVRGRRIQSRRAFRRAGLEGTEQKSHRIVSASISIISISVSIIMSISMT